MTAPTAWGAVQDAAYHLERAIAKEVSAFLFVGGEVLPAGRAVLKEAGDWVQMAHRDVEGLAVSGKKRKEAQAAVLKALKAAERKGVEAATLLFQEKVSAKDAAAACAAISAAIEHELAALEALLALRE